MGAAVAVAPMSSTATLTRFASPCARGRAKCGEEEEEQEAGAAKRRA
jgi:hypothetical protein